MPFQVSGGPLKESHFWFFFGGGGRHCTLHSHISSWNERFTSDLLDPLNPNANIRTHLCGGRKHFPGNPSLMPLLQLFGAGLSSHCSLNLKTDLFLFTFCSFLGVMSNKSRFRKCWQQRGSLRTSPQTDDSHMNHHWIRVPGCRIITVGTFLIASLQIRGRRQPVLTDRRRSADRPQPLQSRPEMWVLDAFAALHI